MDNYIMLTRNFDRQSDIHSDDPVLQKLIPDDSTDLEDVVNIDNSMSSDFLRLGWTSEQPKLVPFVNMCACDPKFNMEILDIANNIINTQNEYQVGPKYEILIISQYSIRREHGMYEYVYVEMTSRIENRWLGLRKIRMFDITAKHSLVNFITQNR